MLEEFQRSLSVHGRELRISVSVGASIYPDHAADAHALLRAADTALFRAKELGRNGWSLFVPQLLEAASSRFKVEQSLRRAVERGEFELLYQPEVCFETLETHTVEALLRWRQPDGNVIAPADFFEVAEQTGLITDISDWALRSAIEAAAFWQSGPWPRARVAVNISSQQFLDGHFVERLESLLSRHSLPAECLEIELTENVLQTGPTTIAALHRLRELGVSIALDDFGTGYSSLTSLERLPLTRVKIDRSLIGTIDTSARSPAIVRSIVGLCHSLGLQVTAEGVERASQLGPLLMDRGVQIQGYLVSRPLQGRDACRSSSTEARRHLEQLMRTTPVPTVDLDASATRLRTLRMPTAAPDASAADHAVRRRLAARNAEPTLGPRSSYANPYSARPGAGPDRAAESSPSASQRRLGVAADSRAGRRRAVGRESGPAAAGARHHPGVRADAGGQAVRSLPPAALRRRRADHAAGAGHRRRHRLRRVRSVRRAVDASSRATPRPCAARWPSCGRARMRPSASSRAPSIA